MQLVRASAAEVKRLFKVLKLFESKASGILERCR